MSWTNERVEEATALWGKGWTASQIAQAIGGGLSRNAVIGKMHRLGMAARMMPSRPGPKRKATADRPRPARPRQERLFRPRVERSAPPTAPQRLAPPVPIEDLIVPVSRQVPLMELNDTMCKWPHGDPRSADFHFCGHDRAAAPLPYCEYHNRLAYRPFDERRAKRVEKLAAAV